MTKLISIELDKARNIRLGHKAINSIEKLFKKPLAKIMESADELTVEEYNKILCIGLQHEDKDLTFDKVMDLVDEYSTTGDIMVAVTEAIEEAMKPLIEKGKAREAEEERKRFVASKNA